MPEVRIATGAKLARYEIGAPLRTAREAIRKTARTTNSFCR